MSVNLGETKVSDILKTVSGGGTSNYNNLTNKPQINGVELVGNKTAEELGIKQGVTEEVLTQALAAETASREKQDELLQGEIDDKLSPHNIIAGDNVEITQDGGNVTISAQNSPIATIENAGIVRPDGETISVDSAGIIRAISGGEAVHVIRNNAEEPFILENNELGYYLLDLDSLGTTSMLPGDPKVFQYGATEDRISVSAVKEETTFILLNYHTDIKESQSKGEIPVLSKYTFDITQDSFPSIYVDEITCTYDNGEYRTGFGSSQYFKIAGADDLPERLSELENDTGFITSEALNPLESNIENLEEQIKDLQTTSFEVVDELPTSDIKTNIIYLVPAQSSGIDNVYDEYIYANGNWEKIGTTALDLSQYATKEYAEMVAANTINDTEVSDLTTYSSSKIESLSGIKVLTGTAEKPIIVSKLETGNYVLSGTVQSSESNTTNQTLSKKVYTVEKGDSETVVWYENPKTHITHTYIFDTVGTNAPEEQNEIYITETKLKQAVIDGGNWVQERVNNGKYNSY